MKEKLLISINLIAVLLCGKTYADGISCQDRYFLDVNEAGEVSCTYDSDFISVRWYRDGIPILRYDGTAVKGPGKESGEFDMTTDGSMIIHNAQLKHEGRYEITVLHAEATSSQSVIEIIIVVPLKSLSIQDCHSDPTDLCDVAQVGAVTHTLVCIAEGANPHVEINWQTVDNENVLLDQSDQTPTTRQISSSSLSTFNYNKDYFTLQIFTCVPHGLAVKNEMSAAILLKGDAPSSESAKKTIYALQGSQFQIECPTDGMPIAQLLVEYQDTKELLLMETNATTLQQHCLDELCRVESNFVHFEKISYVHEGDYICTSSDGKTAIESVTDMTVLIEPENAAVNIEGCEASQECSRNTNRTGSLTCVALGFRPQVELTLTNDADSNLDVKLTNVRRNTENNPVSGTSDSYLTVDYEIMKCGVKASLTCSVQHTNIPRSIEPATILLVRDQQQCPLIPEKESGGSPVVVVVIVIIVVIVIVLAGVGFFLAYQKGIIQSGRRNTEDPENGLQSDNYQETSTDAQGESPAETDTATTGNVKKSPDQQDTITEGKEDPSSVEKVQSKPQKLPDQQETSTDGKGEPSAETSKLLQETVGKKSKSPDKKLPKTKITKTKKEAKPKSTKSQKKKEAKLQAEFNKSFGAIFGPTSESEPLIDKGKTLIPQVLQNFADKHQVATGPYLSAFIEGSTLEKQDLLIILKCVPLEVVNDLISVSAMVDIFHKICQKNQVSDSCLETAREQYGKGTITATDFAQITSPIRGQTKRLEELIKIVKDSAQVQDIESEAADALVQYAVIKPLDDSDRHRNIDYTRKASNKINYTKLVQVIQERYSEVSDRTNLHLLLKTIAEMVLVREKGKFKEEILAILKKQPEEVKVEEIHSVLVRLILFSVERNVNTQDECMEMLHSGIMKKKLEKSLFKKLPRYSLTEGCVNKTIMFEILRKAFQRKEITEDDYLRTCESTLTNHQVEVSEYMDELMEAIEENLVSKEDMMEELRRSEMENVGKKSFFCLKINYLLKKNQLNTEEYKGELQTAVDHNWVTRDHVLEGLQDALRNKLITEELFLSQLKELHEGCELKKHVEALNLSRKLELITQETLLHQLKKLLSKGELVISGFLPTIADCLKRKLIDENHFLQQMKDVLTDDKIKFQTYKATVEDSIVKNMLNQEVYLRELDDLWENRKIDQANYMGAVRSCLKSKLLDQEAYSKHLLKLLQQRKLKDTDVICELKEIFRKSLMQDTTFFQQLRNVVKLSNRSMMEELESCLREEVINVNTFSTQLHANLESKELQVDIYLKGLQHCLHDDLIDVEFYLSTVTTDLENKTFTQDIFVNQLMTGVKNSKLGIDRYINEMRICLKKSLIQDKTYISELLKISSDAEKMSTGKLVFEMKDCLTNKLISAELFCRTLYDLFQKAKIDLEQLIKELQNGLESKQIKEDTFLSHLTNLFIGKQLSIEELMTKLHECVSKNLINEEQFLSQVSSLFIGKKLTKTALLQEYLACLRIKLITLNVFCDQLRALLKDQQIQIEDYLDTLNTALNEKLIDDKFVIETLRDCLQQKSVNETIFLTRLNDLFKTEKITREEFINELRKCLREKVIPDKTYFEQLSKLNAEDKFNMEEFTSEIQSCLENKMISEEQFYQNLNSLLEMNKLELNTLLEQLYQCFEAKIIQENTFLEELTLLLINQKLQKDILMEMFHRLVGADLITKDCFFSQLTGLLNKQKLSVEYLMTEYQNCLKTKLILLNEFCTQLKDLVANKKITVDDYLNRLVMCLDDKTIATDFVLSTLRQCVEDNSIAQDGYLDRLKTLRSRNLLSHEEYVKELRDCLKDKQIDETTFLSQLDNLLRIQKMDVDEFFGELRQCRQNKLVSENIFCERLKKQLQIKPFLEELHKSIQNGLVGTDSFCEQLSNIFQEGKISIEELMDAFHLGHENEKLTVDDYWRQLHGLLKNQKITIDQYVQLLHIDEEKKMLSLSEVIQKLHLCRKDSEMTEDVLCDSLDGLLQKAKLDIKEYTRELKTCLDANLITKQLYDKRIEEQETKKTTAFRDSFHALCADVYLSKGSDEDFQEILQTFHKKYKESPMPFLENYLKNEKIQDTELVTIIKFLSGCKANEYFQHQDMLKIIEMALTKLPADTSLSMITEIYFLHQMTVEEFVNNSRVLLKDKEINVKAILSKLKEIGKSKTSRIETGDTVIQFFLHNLMKTEEIIPQVGFQGVGKLKVQCPYYLQAIQGVAEKAQGQQKTALRSLFDMMILKALDNEVNFRKDAIEKLKRDEFGRKFLRVLIFSVHKSWISADESIAILTSCEKKGQLNAKDLEELPDYFMFGWVDKATTTKILQKSFTAELISEDTYKAMFKKLRKKGKINDDEHTEAMNFIQGK